MKGLRILIVMDDHDAAIEIQEKLMSLGCVVLSVTIKENVKMKLEELGPDLVLIELTPKATSIDNKIIAEQVRARKNVPVVYLIADNDEKLMERTGITEPYEYILKPYTKRELNLVIAMAFLKWEMKEDNHEGWKGLSKTGSGISFQRQAPPRAKEVKVWEDIFKGTIVETTVCPE